MNRIAVIGSLNVDYVSYVEKAPVMGETVLANQFEILPGGKGANQAYAIGRMGASVSMFGAVGNDQNGLIILNNLAKVGVDVSHVLKVQEPTGIASITVNANGNNCIVVAQNANQAVSEKAIDLWLPALIQYDIIVFQLEIPLETVVYASNKLKQLGKMIILDPAPVSGKLPDALLANVDYIKPNETELSKLTDHENDINTACDKLLAQGAKCVLASLGSSGVFVKDSPRDGTVYGVEDVKVVDTTAAGDSFTAAVAYALANNISIHGAVRFGNEVASVVVQRKGAQQSIPSHEEISAIWSDMGYSQH